MEETKIHAHALHLPSDRDRQERVFVSCICVYMYVCACVVVYNILRDEVMELYYCWNVCVCVYVCVCVCVLRVCMYECVVVCIKYFIDRQRHNQKKNISVSLSAPYSLTQSSDARDLQIPL